MLQEVEERFAFILKTMQKLKEMEVDIKSRKKDSEFF